MRTSWLIGAAALLLAGLAQAAVYKWVDEKGRVHYSANPPPSAPATEVRIRPAPPTAGQPQSQGAAQPEAGQDGQPAAAAEPASREEALRKNCEIARNNLEVLENPANRRFRQTDGSVGTFSDAERQAQTEQARKHVKEFCEGD
jgi:hypothetical protein